MQKKLTKYQSKQVIAYYQPKILLLKEFQRDTFISKALISGKVLVVMLYLAALYGMMSTTLLTPSLKLHLDWFRRFSTAHGYI